MNNDIANELFIMNENTVEKLFSLGTDAFVLYSFYYKTKKWQKGVNVWATNDYVIKKLHWGLQRVRMAKKVLEDNGMIQQVRVTNDKGQVESWEIKLLYIQGLPTPRLQEAETEKPTSSQNRLVDNKGQIIYNNRDNIYNNNNTPNKEMGKESFSSPPLVDHFKDLWNNGLVEFYKERYPFNVKIPRIMKSEIKNLYQRDRELKSLIKELLADGLVKADDVSDAWAWAFQMIWERIQKSEFLRGEKKAGDGYSKPFLFDVEYFLRPSNFIKLVSPTSKYCLDDPR